MFSTPGHEACNAANVVVKPEIRNVKRAPRIVIISTQAEVTRLRISVEER